MAHPVTNTQRVLPPAQPKKVNVNDLYQEFENGQRDARLTIVEVSARRETHAHRDIDLLPVASPESAPKADTPSGVFIGESAKRSVVSSNITTKKSIVIKAESAESARKAAAEQSSKDKKSGRASNMPPPGPVGVFIGEQVESSVVAGKDIVADEGITIE